MVRNLENFRRRSVPVRYRQLSVRKADREGKMWIREVRSTLVLAPSHELQLLGFSPNNLMGSEVHSAGS